MLNKQKLHSVVLRDSKQKGFTLIEVVLVLAIGGLIFLLAFLAFSQVQRNRRDAQRRQDARSMLAYIKEFATDNDGKRPCVDYFVGYLPVTGRTSRTRPLSHDTNCAGMRQVLSNDQRFNQASANSSAYTAYDDPSVGPVAYTMIRNNLANPVLGQMTIYIGANCSGSTISYVDSPRPFAVRLRLENNNFFCVDTG